MLVLSLALLLATLTLEIVDHRLQIGHRTDRIVSGKKRLYAQRLLKCTTQAQLPHP